MGIWRSDSATFPASLKKSSQMNRVSYNFRWESSMYYLFVAEAAPINFEEKRDFPALSTALIGLG